MYCESTKLVNESEKESVDSCEHRGTTGQAVAEREITLMTNTCKEDDNEDARQDAMMPMQADDTIIDSHMQSCDESH